MSRRLSNEKKAEAIAKYNQLNHLPVLHGGKDFNYQIIQWHTLDHCVGEYLKAMREGIEKDQVEWYQATSEALEFFIERYDDIEIPNILTIFK